jgi:tetratricopeptide (TPR) repeat protein
LRRLVYILLLTLCSFNLAGQKDKKIYVLDSLLNRIEETTDSAELSKLYKQTAFNYIYVDLIQAELYLDIWRKITEKSHRNNCVYYNGKLIIHFYKRETKIAKAYIDSADNEMLNFPDTTLMASLSNNRAHLNTLDGNYIGAQESIIKSLMLAKYTKSSTTIDLLLFNQALLDYHTGLYNQSLSFLQKIFDKEVDNNYLLILAYNLQGQIYLKKGSYDRALRSLMDAYNLHQNEDNRIVISETLALLGDYHYSRGNMKNALLKYEQADGILVEQGIYNPLYKIKIANICLSLGANNRAESYFKKVDLNYYDDAINLEKKIFLQSMYEYYVLKGDNKRAYQSQKKNIEVSKRLMQRALSQVTMENRVSNEVDQVIEQINTIGSDIEVTNKRIELIRSKRKIKKILTIPLYIVVVIIVIAFVLLLGFYLKYMRLRDKVNSENTQLNNTKDELSRKLSMLTRDNSLLEKQALVAKVTDMSIIMIDPKGTIIWTNDACEKMFDITDSHGKLYKNIFDMRMSQKIKDNILDVAISKKTKHIVERMNVNYADNRWVHISTAPYFNDNDILSRIVIICSDISSYKTMELELNEQKNRIENHRDEIKRQKEEIEKQNSIANDQRKDIVSSIKYAQRIQLAVLPKDEFLSTVFDGYFVINKPHEILTSCFYWAREQDDKIYVVMGESASKDVPGALTGMMLHTILDDILLHFEYSLSSDILDELQKQIQLVLNKLVEFDKSMAEVKVSLVVYNKTTRVFQYSGAQLDMLILSGNKLLQLNGDLSALNIVHRQNHSFVNHVIQLDTNDQIYLFNKGVIANIKGDDYKSKMVNMKSAIQNIGNSSLEMQKKRFEQILFSDFEKPLKEDVLMIGIYVS